MSPRLSEFPREDGVNFNQDIETPSEEASHRKSISLHKESCLIIEGIQKGDQSAGKRLSELVSILNSNLLWTQLPHEDWGDVIQESLGIILKAINNNEIRDPKILFSFARTVVKRKIFDYLGKCKVPISLDTL